MFVCIWEQMEHLLISQIDPKYFQGTHWILGLIKLFLGLFFEHDSYACLLLRTPKFYRI